VVGPNGRLNWLEGQEPAAARDGEGRGSSGPARGNGEQPSVRSWMSARTAPRMSALAHVQSIPVLPLCESISRRAQDYLAEGLTEDLTILSRKQEFLPRYFPYSTYSTTCNEEIHSDIARELHVDESGKRWF